MKAIKRRQWATLIILWIASILAPNTLLFRVGHADGQPFQPSGKLEIHYINVGQGGCTLIVGPDGTCLLYDFGNSGRCGIIVPYLKNKVGRKPEHGLDYTIVSHGDLDHYVGFKSVVDEGYDILVANYGCGSLKANSALMKKYWLKPALRTTAGEVRTIPVGLRIPLGDGAIAIVVAANGKILGKEQPLPVVNENDRSVVLFVSYKNFQYILDGALGAGREKCTRHTTQQRDIQSHVAEALISENLMNADLGVDVMHIANHGSESSTSAKYYNMMKPEVGLIRVGRNQGTFRHPREDVVDGVLLSGDKRAECVTAPALKALFQTEDGLGSDNPGPGEIKRCSSTGCTSYSGTAIGSIKLTTDGATYNIVGDNAVRAGAKEAGSPPKVWSFETDEAQVQIN